MKKIECIKNKNMNYLCDIQSEQITELEKKLAITEMAFKNVCNELYTCEGCLDWWCEDEKTLTSKTNVEVENTTIILVKQYSN